LFGADILAWRKKIFLLFFLYSEEVFNKILLILKNAHAQASGVFSLSVVAACMCAYLTFVGIDANMDIDAVDGY
jgi:hypothetical protein